MKLFFILVFVKYTLAYDIPTIRIVGGSVASEGQFPYQTSLRINKAHSCGGSIIGENSILTAAHCVNEVSIKSIDIVVGTITLAGGIYHSASSYVIHENYDSPLLKNDIAIIKLQTTVQWSSKVQPIDLDINYVNDGLPTVTAGWGLTSYPGGEISDFLLYIKGSVFDLEECRNKLSSAPYPVLDSNICNYASKGQGTCSGDSGGALVVNGKHVGISSWIARCALGYPDVFTRTSNYINWIKNNMK